MTKVGRDAFVGKVVAVPIAGLGQSNDIGFVDEFHYDRDGTRALTESIAPGVEAILK